MLSNALSSLEEHEASVYNDDRPARGAGAGRGGRRRPQRGNGGSGEDARSTMISKKLSWLLRHGAAKEGIPMDSGGWVRVDHLVWECFKQFKWQTLRSLKVTLPELHKVVETNAKKRYEIQRVPDVPDADADAEADEDREAKPASYSESASVEGATISLPDFETTDTPAFSLGRLSLADSVSKPPYNPSDPKNWRIRAAQGHTIETVEAAALLRALDAESPGTPQFVVHGTTERAWKAIRSSGGLSRMRRAQVHFATGTDDAEGDAAVLTKLRAARAATESEATSPSAIEGGSGRPGAAVTQTHGVVPPTLDSSGPSNLHSVNPIVVSGMRSSSTVFIWVDLRASSLTGGLQWWQSSNGVVLTAGDAQGMVPLRWVVLVERQGKHNWREVLWRQEVAI